MYNKCIRKPMRKRSPTLIASASVSQNPTLPLTQGRLLSALGRTILYRFALTLALPASSPHPAAVPKIASDSLC